MTLIRRWLSAIAVRLLLFNVLLVFLPVAGLLSLRSLERQLLDVQERAMVQQGRLVAAALSAEPQLDAERTRSLIRRLGGRSEARIRIVGSDATVIADSAKIHRAPIDTEAQQYEDPVSRKKLLYRIGVGLWRIFDSIRGRDTPSKTESYVDPTPQAVVKKALSGRYTASLRASLGQRSLTLYSALPIRANGNGDVIGAVLVSQSTSRILRALWRVRLDTINVFAVSVAAAVVLTLLMAATIVRPLIRLRNEADELLDRRGRLRRTFRGSRRKDEIGDLTRALEQLTARLERHLAFVESFSADVSHEFKNPLASIRSAAELLADNKDEEQRQLAATIEKEVARLTRLLNAAREVSKVDAAVDTEETTRIDLAALLSCTAPPVFVEASEDRLVQVFRNIIDNAQSFSPEHVHVSIRAEDGHAIVEVDDEGPGIPPEHLDRIFDRFFTFRDKDRNMHDGLGLAIARAVIEGYGGTIRASNLTPRGARIQVRLPLA